MAALTGVVIYDSILFERGHMVRRWADSVERKFTANAKTLAPVNKRANKSKWGDLAAYPAPGALRDNITGDVERIGPKHLQTIINIGVPYAVYVVKGTGPLITAASAPRMVLPFNSGFTNVLAGGAGARGKPTQHKVVSGQSGNDFMDRAADLTALSHPSLRGFRSNVFEQW